MKDPWNWFKPKRQPTPAVLQEKYLARSSCYLVVTQELDEGILKTVRAGLYSTNASNLSGNSATELRSDVMHLEADTYSEARKGVVSHVNVMADLGVEAWVVLRELLPESERRVTR